MAEALLAERVLVAGIGNIFLGDDAFGVKVVRELSRRKLPQGVRLVDFGIRGMDLAYALLDPWQAVLLIDALPRGGTPGTLYVLEPDPVKSPLGGAIAMQPHHLDPEQVLRLAQALGGTARRVIVIGCEPSTIAADMQDGLSPAVDQALRPAADLIERWIDRLMSNAPPGPDSNTSRLTADSVF